jgi:hypothetical protein|tara:strand:- start:159 stop:1289 length:1131 start_codon:yes stop_codon:yes gene_type:complete
MDLQEEELKEFLFPKDDKRLEKFNGFNTEQQLNSIFIGSVISEIGEDKYIRLKSGENQTEKDNLKQMYQQENNKLRENLKRIENNKREREREYIREKTEIRENIRIDLNNHHAQKYIDMEKDILKYKDRCDKYTEKRINNQTENNNKILFQKDEMERKLDEQRKKYEEKLDDLRGKIENMIILTSNSTKKGQEGEDWTFNQLLRLFPKAQIEDCHSIKHRGDFIIKDKYIGMVDSKKFKGNVGKRDVDKFKSDMETNSDFQYGILCATDYGIAAKQDLSLEFVSGKPIVYIHKACENPQKILIGCNLCKLILKNIDCFDVTKEENQLIIKEKTKSIIKIKKKMIKKINDFSESMLELMDIQWTELELVLKQINVKL